MKRPAIAANCTMSGAASVGLLMFALSAACQPIPPERDPFTTADRSELGLPVLDFQWKVQLSQRMNERKPQEFASAALYGRNLIVGSTEGTLFSLATTDGRVMWRAPVGSTSSRPVVDILKGRIFIGTDDGTMLCLRAADGTEVWRYSTRGPILQEPVLADGLVVFSNEADQVFAVDATDGAFRWQYKGETPEEYTLRGHAGVAVSGGLAFTGFASGSMVALRVSTGSVAWLSSLKGDAERFVDVDGTPLLDGDRLYITSSGGGVYALDKVTGQVRWRQPIVGAGGLTVDGGRIYVAAAEQGMYALDRAGEIVWRQGSFGGGEPARPVISGSYLIYGLSEDGMFIADKRTGKVHQYFNPGDGVSSPPTVEPAGDRLYLLSNRGILYALNVHRF